MEVMTSQILQNCEIMGLVGIYRKNKMKKFSLTKNQLVGGRYKSRTGSTRTASPGRINSDRLGPTRIE